MTERHGTCNVACWQATEPECHCQCGGHNHGITRRGGPQPQRLTQRTTGVYELLAITTTWTMADSIARETQQARGFIDNWRDPPILIERADERTLKWPEVQAVHAQNPNKYPTTWLAWVKSPPIPTDPV